MFKPFAKLSPKLAFKSMLALGLVLAIAHIYKDWLILRSYNPPLEPWYFLITFQYSAFSLIAYLFPSSWRKSEKAGPRIFYISVCAILFTVGYAFVSNLIEWIYSPQDYQIGLSFVFTLQHSGILILSAYLILSMLLYALGIIRLAPARYLDKIPHRHLNKTSFIDPNEVDWFEANDNYVAIFSGDKNYLIRETINALEKRLDPQIFQRIHRKYIVNITKISSFETNPTGGYLLHLKGGKKLKLSKSYAHKIKMIKG